ncbi:hypothetical protein BCE02nite_25870 [Brevibacillus centrosporus]|nr:hypothetical protein BCE02nite_25870 [Brevibacillus centrosporus]
MNIGFFVMIALSFLHLESYFRQKANKYFAFLQYVKKYPSLLATGLFCSLGFYIHNFIY